jgi:ABC-type lipopolysaccharide export system ATPase subunit
VGAERLGDILLALARNGTAVILADHHVAEALRVCTHATLLLDGAVAASASAGDFPSHPLVRGRYLGTWQRESLPAGQSVGR